MEQAGLKQILREKEDLKMEPRTYGAREGKRN